MRKIQNKKPLVVIWVIRNHRKEELGMALTGRREQAVLLCSVFTPKVKTQACRRGKEPMGAGDSKDALQLCQFAGFGVVL